MSKNTSIIWEIDTNSLSDIVKRSSSIIGILREIGVKNYTTRYYGSIKDRMMRDDIDFSHINLGLRNNLHRKFGTSHNKIPTSLILVKNCPYHIHSSSLRIRLISENILTEVCYECGIPPEWNGKRLTLQLDHIDGDNSNNELSNLRILCPNCHSQTSTYSGRNKYRNKNPSSSG